MLKAYKYSLLPTDEQKEKLFQWMGMCRFVFNLGLEVKNRAWKDAQKSLSCFDLTKQLTELKHTECQWLKDCPAQSLESSIANLDKAYKSFFAGNGFPKFKSRRNRQSITFRQETRVKGDDIFLSKLGLVKFIRHREMMAGDIRTVVVSKNPSDKWFVSLLIKNEEELPKKNPIIPETAVGIDLGLKTLASVSNGETFGNPRFLQESLQKLRIAQRKLRRRFKNGAKEQSRGYKKQKLVVAKLHEKIKNQREDYLHKVSFSIIKKYDTVCLENLNVAGMIKNEKLAKSISDVGWSRIVTMLNYKADWYGKNVIQISRFEPSSKMCSDCGHIFKELTLAIRNWVCENCGSLHDRDLNAAKNIKNVGLRAKPSTTNVGQ